MTFSYKRVDHIIWTKIDVPTFHSFTFIDIILLLRLYNFLNNVLVYLSMTRILVFYEGDREHTIVFSKLYTNNTKTRS